MKDESKVWLKYSNENLDSAKVLLKSNLFNPCLQNIQQSVEKGLKAVLIEKTKQLKKTHDILELKKLLLDISIEIDIADDDCDFFNSIYLPSKYPITSIIPVYDPDVNVCKEGIKIAERVLKSINQILS
jgi:HEPN domain-containing protein